METHTLLLIALAFDLVFLLGFSQLSYLGMVGKNIFRGRLFVFPVGLGIAALVAYMLSRRAKALNHIDYTFGLPANLRLNGLTLRLNLPVIFTNASPQSAGFNDFFLPVSYEGTGVGELTFVGKAVLTPNSRTSVSTMVAINLVSLSRVVVGILTQGVAKPFRVRGNINMGGVNVYVDEQVAVPGIEKFMNQLQSIL